MACIMISMFVLYALHRKYTRRCTFSVKYETAHHRILFQDEDVFGRLLGSPHSPLWLDSRKQQPAESDHLRILGGRSV